MKRARNPAKEKNWKHLTVDVSRSIEVAHSHLQNLQSRPGLAKPQLLVIRRLTADLKKKQPWVQQVERKYQTGKLPPQVAEQEKPEFDRFVLTLPQHMAGLQSEKANFLASKLKSYSKFLDHFLASGPHGPGGGRP